MSCVLYFVVGTDVSVEIPSIRATVLKKSAMCCRFATLLSLLGGRLIPQYKDNQVVAFAMLNVTPIWNVLVVGS